MASDTSAKRRSKMGMAMRSPWQNPLSTGSPGLGSSPRRRVARRLPVVSGARFGLRGRQPEADRQPDILAALGAALRDLLAGLEEIGELQGRGAEARALRRLAQHAAVGELAGGGHVAVEHDVALHARLLRFGGVDLGQV